MKALFEKLLLEQCEHDRLINRLEVFGISLDSLRIDNWKLIAETLEILPDEDEIIMSEILLDSNYKVVKEDWRCPVEAMHSYDLLSDNFYNILSSITNNEGEIKLDEHKLREYIGKHIDLLLKESEIRKYRLGK